MKLEHTTHFKWIRKYCDSYGLARKSIATDSSRDLLWDICNYRELYVAPTHASVIIFLTMLGSPFECCRVNAFLSFSRDFAHELEHIALNFEWNL